LESLDDLLKQECLPAIESITIRFCDLLLFLPTERFGRFSFLKNLSISFCLENLTSLKSLTMGACQGIVSITGDLWSNNLKSLQKLKIRDCPDLVSIGGAKAIANINTVYIAGCPKLKEIEQILRRGNWRYGMSLGCSIKYDPKKISKDTCGLHLYISCFLELDYIIASFVILDF
ncbi:hypothetical protein BAE44_0012579, partial [Dichanthelium oligosanthes]